MSFTTLKILEACQMIGLGAVILDGQDHSPFAVHLALGDDVAELNFDQSKMRQHLLKGKQ